MASTVTLTGRIVLPGDAAPDSAQIRLQLTSTDTDQITREALPAGGQIVIDLEDGDIPAGTVIWRNTAGLSGSAYNIYLTYTDADGRGRERILADRRTVGDEDAYDLSDLIDAGVAAAAGTYVRAITAAQYNAAITARDEAQGHAASAATAAVAAAVSADQAAFFEGPWFGTSDDVAADTSLTFSSGQPTTVSAGKVVQTRKGGVSLEVAPQSSTPFEWRTNPTGYHRITDGGVPFFINQNRYELSAESFGCKFDGDDAGATDNFTLLQRAADWLYSQGQGGRIRLASEGLLKINKPLIMRDGMILDGRGSYLQNVRATMIQSGDLSTTVLGLGLYAKQDDNDFTYVQVAAISAGQDYVTPASTSGFVVGDTIQIVEATGVFGGSSGTVPLYSQFAVVKAISGGNVILDHPISAAISAGSGTLGSTATGAWVANTSYRVNYSKSAGLTDGRHIVRNITVADLRLGGKFGGWSQRAGVIHGLFENLTIEDSPYGFYGNGFAHCRINGLSGTYYTRAIEVKVGAHDTIIGGFNLRHSPRVTDTADPPETVVSLGERARNVVVRDGQLHLGNSSGYAALVTFSTAKECGVQDVVFMGAGGFTNGVNHSAESDKCFAGNNKINCGAPSGAWLNLNGTLPQITGNRFIGANPGGSAILSTGLAGCDISRNHWTTDGSITVQAGVTGNLNIEGNFGITTTTLAYQAGLAARNNTSAQWQSVISQVKPQASMSTGIALTATTETIIGDVPIIPANALTQEDRITVLVRGTKTGSAGAATLSLKARIDTDGDAASLDPDDPSIVILSTTIAASATDWEFEAELKVNSATTFIAFGILRVLAGGTPGNSGDVTRRTGGSLTSPIRLELSGLVTSGDTLTINSIDRSARRGGMVS